MELQFSSRQLECLKCILHEVQNSEQTQELKLSDSMPDVARVISAWGQPVMRGKEWHGGEILFSGGMLVWVLYASEGDAELQTLNTWIPFQLRWSLPSGTPDGLIRMTCLPRFVDARSVSPRKIMVRCGMAALAEALVPDSVTVFTPQTPAAELLQSSHSLRIPKHAGEKTFLMDEEVSPPESLPVPDRMVYCTMEPKLMENRVLSNKLVFRGVGRCHILYADGEGKLHSWNMEIPFSQLAELGDSFGNDALADIRLMVTGLEPDLLEDGKFRIKASMVGQYLLSDSELVEVAEDAYSNHWELDISKMDLQLPVFDEGIREELTLEATPQGSASEILDLQFLPDFPLQGPDPQGRMLTIPGSFHLLSYGEDGSLQGSSHRAELQRLVPQEEERELLIYPQPPEASANVRAGTTELKALLPMERFGSIAKQIPMVTDIQTGKEKEKDPGRPSVILRRAGKDTLWELAKSSGSSVSAIQEVNHLEGEPTPEQMLLIPVL